VARARGASGEPVAKIAAAFTELAGVPLIVADAKCVDGEQRMALRQDRFTVHDPDASPQHWNVPIVFGPISGARPARSFVLDEPFELRTGPCGEAVKLNLGDVGYYRVQYDTATQALLARSLGAMSPADRVNLISDNWALVEAGRAVPASIFELIDQLANEDSRAVWTRSCASSRVIDHLEQDRPGRAAFQAYAALAAAAGLCADRLAASRKRGPGSGRLARAIDPHTRRFWRRIHSE